MKISTQAGRGRATRYVNVVCTGDHVEAAHSYAPVSLARSPATKSIAVGSTRTSLVERVSFLGDYLGLGFIFWSMFTAFFRRRKHFTINILLD